MRKKKRWVKIQQADLFFEVKINFQIKKKIKQ